MDFEEGLAAFEELTVWAAQHASDIDKNEATTRLQLIDRIFFDCLGWTYETAVAEHYVGGEYADYVLGRPIPKLLVEAKREGAYLDLPVGLDRAVVRIPTAFSAGDEIRAAMEQAGGYAQKRGIAIAVATNGRQLLAFIASRQDGVAPYEGRALVFHSIAAMHLRFRQLWDNLSPAGVDSLVLHRTLGAVGSLPPPAKLSQQILTYPGFKNRNPLQSELQVLGGLFLEDVRKIPELEEEFLEQCYCESGALSQYALVSREILRTRYSSLLISELEATAKPARTKRGVAPEITADMLAASMSRRPLILLGDVGVGKTMFVRHLLRVDAKEMLERAIVLSVDFGAEPAFANDLKSYVIEAFTKQLLSSYGIDIEDRDVVRAMYFSELQRFRKGIYGELAETAPDEYRVREREMLANRLADREAHLRAYLEHVVQREKRQVVIVLDNVDQRQSQFQEEVFLIAQSLAERWPGTVFVMLRPETFYRSKARGSLAAYMPRVFTIAPPRVDEALTKRLTFAAKLLQREGRLPSFPEGLTLNSSVLQTYLAVLVHSLKANRWLIEFFDNLSVGNIRQALSLLESFIGSGHVATQKILDIEAAEGAGSYAIPLHEFMRAVIYGDHEFYDPSSSPVANVFDISSPTAREHFLLLIFLAYIEKQGEVGAREGYVEMDQVGRYAHGLGFTPGQQRFALERANGKGLVELSPKFEGEALGTHIRITASGAYTLKRLPAEFTYVDAMIIDTPIVDLDIRREVRNVVGIQDRLQRADIFRAYLDRHWYGLDSPSIRDTFDWPAVSDRLHASILRIGQRIDPEAW